MFALWLEVTRGLDIVDFPPYERCILVSEIGLVESTRFPQLLVKPIKYDML